MTGPPVGGGARVYTAYLHAILIALQHVALLLTGPPVGGSARIYTIYLH